MATTNKRDLVWLIARLGITGLAWSVCCWLVSMSNTGANLFGGACMIGILYYWVPSDETIRRFKEGFIDE